MVVKVNIAIAMVVVVVVMMIAFIKCVRISELLYLCKQVCSSIDSVPWFILFS